MIDIEKLSNAELDAIAIAKDSVAKPHPVELFAWDGRELRYDYEFLSPAEWTPDEALHHITGTFDRACIGWPEVMEPYIPAIVDAIDDKSKMDALRHALRETIGKRI